MAKKSFNVRSKELGINGVPSPNKLIRDYLKGKTVEIIGSNANGHNYGAPGTRHKIDVVGSFSGGSGNTYDSVSALIQGGNQIRFTNFHVIETFTIEDLEKENDNLEENLVTLTKDIKDNIKLNNQKIEYLKETNLKTFDENEFKVYSTLNLLEDKTLNKIEKAKIIAKLVK